MAAQNSPSDTQFHILTFEGPDGYARAGGIATRITGLSEALAEVGFETHLWFAGDPHLPGHERRGSFCRIAGANGSVNITPLVSATVKNAIGKRLPETE
jgi:hypothetical protein